MSALQAGLDRDFTQLKKSRTWYFGEVPGSDVGAGRPARSTSEETAIRSYFEQKGLPLCGIIPYDECITQADLNAQALIDFQGDAPSVIAIEQLLDKVLEISRN